jgi:hypothetical protein
MTTVINIEGGTRLKADAIGDGMDEDGEGPKTKYRKIKCKMNKKINRVCLSVCVN